MNETGKPSELTVRWLDPARIQARWEPESVRLTVRINSDDEIRDARATLAFPISCPEGYVELSDSKGGEPVGIIRSLKGMPPESMTAIRSALAARYMIPGILRIIEIKEVSPFVLRWRVETDRGTGVFFSESPREAVRYLGHERIRVTDLAGNHFDIPSISSLDSSSRAMLSTFL